MVGLTVPVDTHFSILLFSVPGGLCVRCRPVLSRFIDQFKGLTKRGNDLKKVKKVNSHPKKPDVAHYRDLKAQNEWLQANVFDPMGNYLFCCSCIRKAFGISQQRLARQRYIKRMISSHPMEKMSKATVLEDNLAAYVVMPEELEQDFRSWWMNLKREDVVEVKVPHNRHGLAGKVSNSAKTDVKERFLSFIDSNSQPNGRSDDSYGPTQYLIPKFVTIQAPKTEIRNYGERCKTSLTCVFNQLQQESGLPMASSSSISTWLKQLRPRLALYPHKNDYCDTCAGMKNDISAREMSMKRLTQSGSAGEESLLQLESEIASLRESLDEHKKHALESRTSYNEDVCACKTQWQKIGAFDSVEQRTADQEQELQKLKENFVLVLAADYQQSKLVPYWGLSPQPSSTYYLMKMSYDIFGITDHRTDSNYVYVAPETIGPKNTDHTISYIHHYVFESENVPDWIKRIHLYMDNACSTNKNRYMIAYCQELVQHKLCNFVRLSFMVAGHTKFCVDRLFSQVATTYNRSDVFNADDLGSVIAAHAPVTFDDGKIVKTWRSVLQKKYSKIDGVRGHRDFVVTKHLVTEKVILRVRPFCYGGPFRNDIVMPKRGHACSENAMCSDTDSYLIKSGVKELASNKLAHLSQMYSRFIPRIKWPSFVCDS